MNRFRLLLMLPLFKRSPLLGLLLIAFLLCLAGCDLPTGKRDLKLVPVAGQVTLDAEPVTGAKVVFLPEELFGSDGQPLPAPSGLTDDSGRFQLQTEGEAGAPAGNYRVLISKREMPADSQPGEMSDAELARRLAAIIPGREPEAWMAAELIPAYYNLQTKLRYIVPPAGAKRADFPLSIFDRPLQPRPDSQK